MLKEIVENLYEDLEDIKTKNIFPDGTFSIDKTPEEIAKIVCKYSKDYKQAEERVTFHYNRSGKKEVDRHLQILNSLKSICKK